MANQRQNVHDQEAVPCKHSNRVNKRHPIGEDLYLQEQARQRQEKPN